MGATVTVVRQGVEFHITNSGLDDIYLHIRPQVENGLLPERGIYISSSTEFLPEEGTSLVSGAYITRDELEREYQTYESTLPGVAASFK